MTKRMYTFDLSFSITGRNVQEAVQELHALLLEKGLDEANTDFHVLSEDDDAEFAGWFDDAAPDAEGVGNSEVGFRWVGGERDGQALKETALLWS